MKDGIYHTNFTSSLGITGDGLVVVKDGSVNGGDPAYLYTGTITSNSNWIAGQININKWNQAGNDSVFGATNNFDLAVQGNATDKNFTISGHMVGQPALKITIEGTFLSEAS